MLTKENPHNARTVATILFDTYDFRCILQVEVSAGAISYRKTRHLFAVYFGNENTEVFLCAGVPPIWCFSPDAADDAAPACSRNKDDKRKRRQLCLLTCCCCFLYSLIIRKDFTAVWYLLHFSMALCDFIPKLSCLTSLKTPLNNRHKLRIRLLAREKTRAWICLASALQATRTCI